MKTRVLTRAERKALAARADIRAARPTVTREVGERRSTGPVRGVIDVTPREKFRGFKVELNLPSPCDKADRAKFAALYALRDEEFRHTLERAKAESVHLRAHHAH